MNTTLRMMAVIAALALVPIASGCSDDNGGGNGNGDGGSGDGAVGDGGDGGGGLATCGGAIVGPTSCNQVCAAVRDFKFAGDPGGHPDFENINMNEPDWDFSSGSPMWTAGGDPYLSTMLDADAKPQFLPGVTESPNGTIHSPEGFAAWYRNTSYSKGPFYIVLDNQAGTGTCAGSDGFCYDSANLPGGQFFPIDGRGWGNEGEDADGTVHNFSFTTEIVATFTYEEVDGGSQTFTFSGDDDVWIFVNDKLAVDIGGLHGVETKTVTFSDIAGYLGIEPGNTYSIRLFHAERHTHASNFRFETNIRCLILG